LLGRAKEQGLIKGRRARVDTTVVETNISYSTDSGLLADGVRVLTRALQRIEQATGVVGQKLRNHKRASTRDGLMIAPWRFRAWKRINGSLVALPICWPPTAAFGHRATSRQPTAPASPECAYRR